MDRHGDEKSNFKSSLMLVARDLRNEIMNHCLLQCIYQYYSQNLLILQCLIVWHKTLRRYWSAWLEIWDLCVDQTKKWIMEFGNYKVILYWFYTKILRHTKDHFWKKVAKNWARRKFAEIGQILKISKVYLPRKIKFLKRKRGNSSV